MPNVSLIKINTHSIYRNPKLQGMESVGSGRALIMAIIIQGSGGVTEGRTATPEGKGDEQISGGKIKESQLLSPIEYL